ncbi:MAG: Ig-like domain-containing protein [Clostridiales bacterium]|jgi:hypothetical protein|nr:Ig-like domain-containing protein [Clostridiales bacterium]
MTNKRFKTAVFAVLLSALSAIAFAACKKSGTEPPPQVSVSLDVQSAVIDVYEEFTLTPTVQNAENGAVVWSSSNPSVASVSGGVVRGVSAGAAVVKAAVGDVAAECAVTVEDNGRVPVFGISFERIALNPNVALPVNASLEFKDAQIGIAVQWSVDEPSVAEASAIADSPGSALVTGKAPGAATLTARASYGGLNFERTAAVTVKNVGVLELANLPASGGGYKLNLIRSKPAGAAEQSLNTSFTPQILLNGAAASGVTWVSSNPLAAAVDPSTGEITASGVGDAVISASCSVPDLDVAGVSVNVSVALPTVPLAGLAKQTLQKRSAAPAEFLLPDAARSDGGVTAFKLNGTDVFASYNGADYKVTVDADAILTVKAGLDTPLRVETPLAAYTLNCDLVTLAIGTAVELGSVPALSKAEGGALRLWGGYFILTGNIDCGGAKISSFCGIWDGAGATGTASPDTGWVGTFDGRGFHIKNLWFEAEVYGGLFGMIGAQGVVKNVAFVDVSVTLTAGNPRYANFIAWGTYGLVENVFVSGTITNPKSSTATTLGTSLLPFVASGSNGIVRNVMAELKNIDSLPSWAGAVNNTALQAYTNVYVIGPAIASIAGGVAVRNYDADCLYPGVADFASANPDLSGFDTAIWETSSTKIPVFKTHKDAFTPAENTRYNK